MYVARLQLTNLRAIAATTLEFRYPTGSPSDRDGSPNNVNLLLGDNATGKTTILAGVALAVLSRVIEGSGYRPYHLVRNGTREGLTCAELMLHPQDAETALPEPAPRVPSHLRLTLRGSHHELDWRTLPGSQELPTPEPAPAADVTDDDRLWERLYQDRKPGFLLLGYGATRRVERSETFDPSLYEKQRSLRFQRVAGLFEDHIALVPLGAWFPKLRNRRRQEIISLIRQLLPNGLDFSATTSEGEKLLFEQDGVGVPFSALSDGHRAYIGMITDMLYRLHCASESSWRLADLPGVVLIDEIDLHLHPSWQRMVLNQLARTLPRLQFIVSSHSAIVAGTVSTDSLFVLDRNADGTVTARRPRESIYGKSVEDILLSRYFGLKTTRAPGAVDEARKLSRRALEGDSEAAMEFLRLMAGGPDQPSGEAAAISGRTGLAPRPPGTAEPEPARRVPWPWLLLGLAVLLSIAFFLGTLF